jgi:hypothetical protein
MLLKEKFLKKQGLTVTEIENQDEQILTNNNKTSFSIQCIKPFATYQTTQGPVDSFGVCFVCKAEGTFLSKGDDSIDAHFATISEINRLIDSNEFSDIDKPAMMLFMRDRIGVDMS